MYRHIRDRIENIVNVLNTRSPFEFTVLTNSVDIDTEVVISPGTIMNNTTLEVFNANNNDKKYRTSNNDSNEETVRYTIQMKQ